jgi:hypothetical protein
MVHINDKQQQQHLFRFTKGSFLFVIVISVSVRKISRVTQSISDTVNYQYTKWNDICCLIHYPLVELLLRSGGRYEREKNWYNLIHRKQLCIVLFSENWFFDRPFDSYFSITRIKTTTEFFDWYLYKVLVFPTILIVYLNKQSKECFFLITSQNTTIQVPVIVLPVEKYCSDIISMCIYCICHAYKIRIVIS